MDQIAIKDLECYCHHGVLKEENVLGQKFLVSAILYCDTQKAGMTDDLSYSINYAEAAHVIYDHMKENQYQLLETAAEKLADLLLHRYPSLEQVDICIKKPWAPILLPLDTVSVTISRKWETVYIGAGSNMGDREAYIQGAFEGIRKDINCRKLQRASLYETEPYGYVEQERFINTVFTFETLYHPQELLDFLHGLEQEGNRVREIHWGPRTIDLDILFYGDAVIQEEHLIVPHREIPLREFVLEPLQEIAPFVRHPVNGKTVLQMYEELKKGEKSQ